jgi:subtilisin family serine protease
MQHQKLAPGLMFALRAYEGATHEWERRSALAPHARLLGLPTIAPSLAPARPPVAPLAGAARAPLLSSPLEPRVVVFLHVRGEKRHLKAATRKLITVNQDSGKIRTAYVPLDALGPLSEDPAVLAIRPARYLRPNLDVALPRVNIPSFRTASGLTGKGVVVGIVDSGIDPNHPAFAGRILRIWDQTLPTAGGGVAEGAYGVELAGALMGASRDTNGHGTHVAGIAAGADATFGGVSPEADLIVVKTDFLDAHISDGIRYIFRVAGELNRPAVVNLSLGGHSDAHDGTDSLSQIIDSESGPGRIVCCAAGNEGDVNIHAQLAVAATGLATARFLVPNGSVGVAELNGWYTGAATLEVSVRTPGGFVTNFQPVLATGLFTRNYSLPDAEVSVATPGPNPDNGDHQFLLQIRGIGGAQVTGGVWQLRLRGPGVTAPVTVDVWSLDDHESSQVVFTGTSAQPTMKIGSPGVAAAAVTVASFTTSKVSWTDVDGNKRAVGLAPDALSGFSSPGPTRTGQPKPDVTAPGAMIVSAFSGDSSPQRAMIIDSIHVVEAGTSMATPVIAGLTALLLQRNKTLDPLGLKALLASHSTIPGKPAGATDFQWGAGLIDASGL